MYFGIRLVLELRQFGFREMLDLLTLSAAAPSCVRSRRGKRLPIAHRAPAEQPMSSQFRSAKDSLRTIFPCTCPELQCAVENDFRRISLRKTGDSQPE
jgi:hypothetical protein